MPDWLENYFMVLAPLLAGQLYEAYPAWPFQFSLLALPVSMVAAYFFLRPAAGSPLDEPAPLEADG